MSTYYLMGNQLSLLKLITKLEQFDPDKQVIFDFVNFHPTKIHSYRGYYDHLAIGYSNEWLKLHTVQTLSVELKDAIGKVFTGYKGGNYTMHAYTPMWVANYNEAGGTAISGVIENNGYVMLQTEKVD